MKFAIAILIFVAPAGSPAWAAPQQPAAAAPATAQSQQTPTPATPPAAAPVPAPTGASQTSQPAPPTSASAPPSEGQKSTAPAAGTTPQATAPAPPAAAPPAPTSMDPTQVRALLYQIYTAGFRITDLLSTLQPDKWKMDDAGRQTFGRTVGSIRTGFGALEKPRTQLYNSPQDVESGEAVDAALSALLPDVDALAQAVGQNEGAAAAAQFTKPRGDLADLQQSLESYLAFLRPPAGAKPSSSPTVPTAEPETEVVTPPEAAAPPVTLKTVTEGPGYLSPPQVKTLLHGVYMESYRVRDLLGVLHPEQLSLSDTERSAVESDVEVLRKALDDLEQWRGELDEQPGSMYFSFQTYAALNALAPHVDALTRALAGLGQAGLADQYGDPEQKLSGFEQSLSSYVGYLLRNQHQIVGSLEDDLVSCQTTLGSAMRPQAEAAVPMKNVMPVFQGHPPGRHPAKKTSAHARKGQKIIPKDKDKKHKP